MSFNLKLISSKLGVKLLQLCGMSAHREGNVIDLGFTQLQVVDACSGLRYLFPLLIMGILLAYFYRAALWKRLVLVASTIPLTLLINSLRIAITGIIYTRWGAAAAEGFFHGFSGWLIFIVSLLILLAEMKVLGFWKKVSVKSESFKISDGEMVREPSDSRPKTSSLTLKTFLSPPHFVVASLVLILTLGISTGVEFREKIPIKKPFTHFPLEVNEWSGKRDTMEQRFVNALDFSDYVMADYKDRTDKQVNFYVAYYESQRKGESIHSPETCLPGSGWEFREAGPVMISPDKGNPGPLKVNRAFMTKPGVRQLVYFWFAQRGRVITNAYQLKLYTFWDALTRRRTDGALVRIITPVYPDEQLQDAETRLQGFTKEMVPMLEEYIPK
jgi:exosortase D (VPLPA-CTERM-specific)